MKFKPYFITAAAGLLLLGTTSGWAQSFYDAAASKPQPKVSSSSGVKASAKPITMQLGTRLNEGQNVANPIRRTKGLRAPSIDKLPASALQINYTEGAVYYNCNLAQPVVNDTTITITNFDGLGTTITGTVDKETGVVQFPRQSAYVSSTYGNCDLIAIDMTSTSIIDGPLCGKIEEGILTLEPWALLITEGDKAGYSLGSIVESSVFNAPNATMNATRMTYDDSGNYASDVEESYAVLCEQTSTNEVTVYNFLGDGYRWLIRINGDKTLSIIPQFAFTNSSYGSFYYYQFDPETVVTNFIQPIKGTTTDNLLSWGGAALHTSNGKYYAKRYRKSSIQLPFDLKYPTTATQDGFKGSGTEEDPYLIENIADLITLSDNVNYNNPIADGATYAKLYEGVYFKQTANINAKDYNFPPIGGNDDYFRFAGNYDGNNKTIQNLNINTGKRGYAGLFGAVDTCANIKNLKFTNPVIRMTNYYYAGVVAGNCLGKLQNITVTGGDVDGYLVVGGIAGQAGSSSNCTFQGKVTGYSQIGGVFAVTREPCSFLSATNTTVTLTGTTTQANMGGVVGTLTANRGGTVTDSYFSGDLVMQHSGQFCGGVVGTTSNVKVERCFSTAKIYNSNVASQGAGIGGIVGAAMSSQINDCYFAGENLVRNTYSGGIVGYVINVVLEGYTNTVCNRCYVSGIINPTTEKDYTPYVGLYDTRTEGTAPETNNCYYDNQILPLIKVLNGSKPHSDFTAETPNLDGFSSDVWVFTKDLYPRLKNIEANQTAYLSAAAIMFANERENVETMTQDFTCTTTNSIKWSILKNGVSVTDGNGLDVTNNSNFHLNGTFATDTIVATVGSLSKFYIVKLSPNNLFEGSGSAEDPYLLKTKADLITLSKATNENKLSFNNTHFLITNDIDMEGDQEFMGIGYPTSSGATYGFGGVLDGGNHYIHNIKMIISGLDSDGNILADGKGTNYGFVNNLKSIGTVRNVRIAKDCQFVFYTRSAAVVGFNYGGLIENCRNYADVTAYVGTVAGITSSNGQTSTAATATVRNCYNEGTITAGYQFVGGIVSSNYGTIENCVNAGDVRTAVICNNYTYAKLNSAGGISHSNFGTIRNVLNTGHIFASKYSGGLIGWINKKGIEMASSSLNLGMVEYDPQATTDQGTIGNIIGKLYYDGTISNVYYDGQLSTLLAAHGKDHEGVTALTTSQLTSGTAIEGLSDEYWYYEAGYYPTLKTFLDEPGVQAGRASVVYFGDNERSNNIKSDCQLMSLPDLTWTVKKGNAAFSVVDNVLSMDAVEVLTDTVVANYKGYVKEIPVIANPDTLSLPLINFDKVNTVTFSCDVEGVTYYYTIDGTEPTTGSLSTTSTATVPAGEYTLKVMAVKHNYYNSPVADMLIQVSGVDGINTENDIVERVYISYDGQRVQNPTKGIYIMITTYADGTTDTQRVVVK